MLRAIRKYGGKKLKSVDSVMPGTPSYSFLAQARHSCGGDEGHAVPHKKRALQGVDTITS